MNSPGSGKLMLPGAVLVCAVAMLLSCGGGGGGGGGSGPYLVGAHYYVWYPSNFEQGYLRAVLEPPEAPALGEYSSDMVTIARRYFGHPSYLRIDGRPVVIVYLSREIHGLFPQAMSEMRQSLAAEGYDPFVIGDEIFWTVIEANEDPSAPGRGTGNPQVSRIRLFDAITAYNLYSSERPQDRGYGSASAFVPDSVALYQRYRGAGGVPIVPGVIPGYNDRGTRLAADHFAIPRRWSADAPEGSFFTESIERIGKPLADGTLGMILITSWNEWNEDTAIEPVAPAPATRDDASGR